MTNLIKRIALSEKDIESLKHIASSRELKSFEQPQDYKNKVTLKPWGHEFLIFENNCVAIWYLHIRREHSTSMHCHPRKKTALILLSGRALCNTFLHRNFLSAGDALMIDAAVFHSTKALSLEGIFLVEVETPPLKTDLARLDDNYGRELYGYEGHSEMHLDNLDKYNYFFFEESACHNQTYVLPQQFAIAMESYTNNEEFQRAFQVDPSCIYCVCRGRLLTSRRESLVELGEVQSGTSLQEQAGVVIDQSTTLMRLKPLS